MNEHHDLEQSTDAVLGDLTFGVRSLLHAVLAAGHVRQRGGTARVDVGRFGWPATVVIPGPCSPWSRRAAKDAVLAMDPNAERLRRPGRRGTSVRAQTIRWALWGEDEDDSSARCG